MDSPDAPATKRDPARMADRLVKAIGNMRVEVLKALSAVQESVDLQFRSLDTAQEALDARMDVLERRLAEIEKRLLMPPAG